MAEIPNQTEDYKMELSEVCTLCNGLKLIPNLHSGQYGIVKVIRPQDITEDGRIDTGTLTTKSVPKDHFEYTVGAGDVLFRSEGDSNTAACVPDGLTFTLVAVMPIYILRPNQTIILPEYLAWQIKKPSSQVHFERLKHGRKKPVIKQGDLGNLRLDVPDIESQSLILETVALIQKRNHMNYEMNQRLKVKSELELSILAEDLGTQES